jgi:hypothetical protein
MRTLPLYCWNADVVPILLKCKRCRYIVEMRMLPLYCWNAEWQRLHFNNIAVTSAFQQYSGNVRISTIWWQRPHFNNIATTSAFLQYSGNAILLKCGCCRYIVEMQKLPLYCWNADVAAILLKCRRCRYIVAFQQYSGNVRISTI